ncbi:MAG TPA: hypothetical protein VH394_17405 [Thermoanaerobaculia bacterium]|jgi:hypothetical protein|nr:hypothetical protein [Thermoanaerobaculia bacterium]
MTKPKFDQDFWEQLAALDPKVWELVVAEERPRAVAGTGVDAVIRARRKVPGPSSCRM